MLVVAALVTAAVLGSAGTFLAVSQATHQPVTPLVQAVFTHRTPWASQAELYDAAAHWWLRDQVADPIATVLEPGIQPWNVTPGKFYEGSQGSETGAFSTYLLPAFLTGSDLPAGTTIRVRVAGGAGEIQTCSHNVLTDPAGRVVGDGWDCSRPGAGGWVGSGRGQ